MDVPTEQLRVAVNVVTDGTRRRLGRVQVAVNPDTLRATASRDGTTIASATVASSRSFGTRAWELTMTDGSTWVVQGKGCNCGGG